MILAAEIALVILGLYALVKGKLTLSKTEVVRGTAARLLGVIALLPLPLSFAVGLAVGLATARQGRIEEFRWLLVLAEVGIVAVCIVTIYVVGWSLAEQPEPQFSPSRRPAGTIESWTEEAVTVAEALAGEFAATDKAATPPSPLAGQ